MEILLGVILGGFISWLISRSHYKASSKDLERELAKQTRELNSPATMVTFERKLSTGKWEKEFMGHDEYWVYEADRTYQMKMGDDDRAFKEKWTEFFPDPYTKMFHIQLHVSGVTIKSIPFISADGGRYILPLPKLKVIDDEPSFHWYPNSIEYKIAEVIGLFYREKSLRDVAQLTGIEIINESHAA